MLLCEYLDVLITQSKLNLYSSPGVGLQYRRMNKQDVLPCALTLTAYIQFPLLVLFGLFSRPFGGQRPSSVVDHGI
jgi:hypothetical protein